MFRAWRRPSFVRVFRRCSSFLSPAAASPIRPSTLRTTPVSPLRNTIVWYAYIISAATVIDTGIKQSRRHHWDSAIAQAEESLNISPEKLAALKQSILSQQIPPTDTLSHSVPAAVDDDRTSQSTDTIFHNSRQNLDPRPLNELFQSRSEDGITFPLHTDRIPTFKHFSIYHTRSAGNDSQTPVWTPKKLVRSEYSIAKLAARLTKLADSPDGSDSQNHISDAIISEASGKLRATKHVDTHNVQDLTRLRFPLYDLSQTAQEVQQKELSIKLQYTIAGYSVNRFNWRNLIRKIAYLLMNSNTAPGLVCYTLLISYLSRLHFFRAVDMIITAMWESCIRHDEMSLCAVLNHYIRAGYPAHFHRIVIKIQGRNYGGLMLADPSKHQVNEENTPGPHPRTGKIIQSFRLNQRIAYSIIRGYLLLGRERLAVKWLHKCQNQGIGTSIQLANVFLQHYCSKENWKSLDSVWDQIHQRIVNGIEDITPKDERDAYIYAMHSCHAQGKTDEAKALFQEACSRGWSPDTLLEHPKRVNSFMSNNIEISKRKRMTHILETRGFAIFKQIQAWTTTIQHLSAHMDLSDSTRADVNRSLDRIASQNWETHFLDIPLPKSEKERFHERFHFQRRSSVKQQNHRASLDLDIKRSQEQVVTETVRHETATRSFQMPRDNERSQATINMDLEQPKASLTPLNARTTHYPLGELKTVSVPWQGPYINFKWYLDRPKGTSASTNAPTIYKPTETTKKAQPLPGKLMNKPKETSLDGDNRIYTGQHMTGILRKIPSEHGPDKSRIIMRTHKTNEFSRPSSGYLANTINQ